MSFLNQNQFAQTPVLGQVDLAVSPNTQSVRINPDSVSTNIVAGQAVKLITGASGITLVDVPTSITDGPIWGVIAYSPRKNTYAAGDVVTVACQGDVIYLQTSAAVSRGTKVATTVAGPTVATNAVSTNQITGIAIDQASASGQLIRVQVYPSTN